jgi:transposase-like protein
MSKKTRQHRSVQKKAELLRAHLDQKRPVSEICEESELQPSVFYTWQRQLVATAEVALAARAGAQQASRQRRARRVTPSRAPTSRRHLASCQVSAGGRRNRIVIVFGVAALQAGPVGSEVMT